MTDEQVPLCASVKVNHSQHWDGASALIRTRSVASFTTSDSQRQGDFVSRFAASKGPGPLTNSYSKPPITSTARISFREPTNRSADAGQPSTTLTHLPTTRHQTDGLTLGNLMNDELVVAARAALSSMELLSVDLGEVVWALPKSASKKLRDSLVDVQDRLDERLS